MLTMVKFFLQKKQHSFKKNCFPIFMLSLFTHIHDNKRAMNIEEHTKPHLLVERMYVSQLDFLVLSCNYKHNYRQVYNYTRLFVYCTLINFYFC